MSTVPVPTPGLRPRSLSASALQVAGLCMARYKAENIEYSRGFGTTAASLGTAVHGALEMYVKVTQLDGDKSHETLAFLLDCFKMSFAATFGTSDTSSEDYKDGVDMLKGWFKRMDWSGVKVLSVESKTSFELHDKKYDYKIPFNYIFDRLDRLGDPGDKVYRVVDYKTNRWGMRPDDLDKKLQARIYGLVCQMMYPDAERIWVQFDLLRHERVGRVFSKDQNAQTWRLIKSELRRILDTPEDEAMETLNPECRFCVRKTTCNAYLRNAASGGVFSFGDVSEIVDRRATLQWQKAAIEQAIAELDTHILTEMKAKDITEFETDMVRLDLKISRRRNISPEMVKLIVGDEMFYEYGGVNLTMGKFDALLKDPELDDSKKAQLKQLVTMVPGEERVNIVQRNAGLD